MSGEERTFRCVVRNGVIVLDPGVMLPDGTTVTVTVHPITPRDEAEVQQLSEEAVREADQWERQE
jgi:hypothetical protein